MKTIITRNTNETFTQVQTREDGKTLELTFSKGSNGYKNTCMKFHSKDVEIKAGNFIED